MENGVQEALGEVFRRLREEAVCTENQILE